MNVCTPEHVHCSSVYSMALRNINEITSHSITGMVYPVSQLYRLYRQCRAGSTRLSCATLPHLTWWGTRESMRPQSPLVLPLVRPPSPPPPPPLSLSLSLPPSLSPSPSLPLNLCVIENFPLSPDRAIGEIQAVCEAASYALLITSDHGNAERMIDEDGKPVTKHSTFRGSQFLWAHVTKTWYMKAYLLFLAGSAITETCMSHASIPVNVIHFHIII